MYGILSDTEKMVKFRKQQPIHEKEDALTALLLAATKKIEAVDPKLLNLREALEYVKDTYNPAQAAYMREARNKKTD